jgi:hypothetical protein
MSTVEASGFYLKAALGGDVGTVANSVIDEDLERSKLARTNWQLICQEYIVPTFRDWKIVKELDRYTSKHGTTGNYRVLLEHPSGTKIKLGIPAEATGGMPGIPLETWIILTLDLDASLSLSPSELGSC